MHTPALQLDALPNPVSMLEPIPSPEAPNRVAGGAFQPRPPHHHGMRVRTGRFLVKKQAFNGNENVRTGSMLNCRGLQTGRIQAVFALDRP